MNRIVGAVAILTAIGGLALAQNKSEDHGHTKDALGREVGRVTAPAQVTAAGKRVGATAPAFTTVDTNGTSVPLKTLLKRPTVLVFIELECPCCRSGRPYFDRVQNYYGDVANVVGIVVGDLKTAQKWRREARPQFRVLADPGGKIATAYGAEDGLAMRLISPRGRIVMSTPGYNAQTLRELSRRLASMAGVRARPMPIQPAPTAMTSGCSLGL